MALFRHQKTKLLCAKILKVQKLLSVKLLKDTRCYIFAHVHKNFVPGVS